MTTQQNHSGHRKTYQSGSGAFSRMIDELMNTNLGDVIDSACLATKPFVNVKETDTAYEILVAAPGLSKQDFSIRIREGMLHISADAKTADAESFKSREFDFSRFNRVFRLNEKTDTENISARYDNGILTVMLPKLAQDQVKHEIKVE